MAQGRISSPTTAVRWPRDGWALPALEKAGVLSADAAAALRAEAPEWVAHTLVERGIATAERALELLARASHAPAAELDKVDAAAVHLLPEAVARQYAALPLTVTNRTIRIATANPLDFDAERALGFATSRAVEFLYALPGPLATRIGEVYRPERSLERLVDGLAAGATVEPTPDAPPPPPAPPATAAPADATVEAPAARLVEATLADGIRARASEIVFEPEETGLVIRYRVDGVLRDVTRVPRNASGAVTRRLKVAAKLPIADPHNPHEGRATARVDGKLWELRVATAPVPRLGERALVRVSDPSAPPPRLEEMGLWPDELLALEALLQKNEGLVLVTGPSGSGRASTVAAAQQRMRAAGADLVTLDIRYAETANAACQTAASHRLVLATLDAADAAGGVARLRELGVGHERIAATLTGVIALRLLRRLCPSCAEPAGPDSLPAAWRPPAGWLDRQIAVRKARGCDRCGHTGYRGRSAIAEIVRVGEELLELIARDEPADAMRAFARRHGVLSLWDAGLRRVWSGETAYAEAVRVLGEPAAPPAQPAEAPQRPAPLVLIADDDPAMRDLESAILHAAGLAVAESADGAEALDKARTLHPALMLLDMDMPVMNGFEVLEKLRSTLTGRGIPVIVVTVHDDPETESRCIELGAEDYITKPIKPATLVARIRAVLRRVDGGTTAAWQAS